MVAGDLRLLRSPAAIPLAGSDWPEAHRLKPGATYTGLLVLVARLAHRIPVLAAEPFEQDRLGAQGVDRSRDRFAFVDESCHRAGDEDALLGRPGGQLLVGRHRGSRLEVDQQFRAHEVRVRKSVR